MNQPTQEPCELAEIVYEKPLSGAFQEVLFGSDKGNTLWVKFSDKDGANEWIGKFGVGGSGAGRVIRVTGPDIFLVSAGGYVYLVNATKHELLNQYCNDRVQDVAYDNQRKLLIAATYTQLHWVEFGGKILFSRDVAVDGIRDLKIEGRVLTGLAVSDYGGKEKRFRFDLDELRILDWENAFAKNPNSKKPWWKIW